MPIAGELVTETFDYDDGRQVTVYVPPNPPEAIVFAADGQMIAQLGGTLEAADVPPTMIVGVHRVADETLLHACLSWSCDQDKKLSKGSNNSSQQAELKAFVGQQSVTQQITTPEDASIPNAPVTGIATALSMADIIQHHAADSSET